MADCEGREENVVTCHGPAQKVLVLETNIKIQNIETIDGVTLLGQWPGRTGRGGASTPGVGEKEKGQMIEEEKVIEKWKENLPRI